MANLNYSHTENFGFGMVMDFYYCTKCGSRYSVRHGEAPYVEECEDCKEKFEGFEYNDQIGGQA